MIRLGGGWTMFRGKRLKVLAASFAADGSTGDERSLEEPAAGLRLVTVQPEGKAAMALGDFTRGVRLQPGEFFE